MNENNSDTEEKSSTKGRPFVLGLLSLVFGLMGFVTPFLAVIGIVLGIVGLVKKNRKALCILGLIFSLLAFLVSAGRSSRNTGTISSTGSDPEQSETAVSEATSAQQTTVTDNRKKAATSDSGEENAAEEVSVSADDFEIKEYPYENSIGDTLYFLVIRNNSQATVDISGNGTALDSAGNTIGADDCSLDVLGPGEESITYFYFDSVTGIDHVEYTLDYAPETYYDSVISEISLEETVNDMNLTVTATNNGDKPANFVEAYALFMDTNDKIVGYSSNYITDSSLSLQPGASLSAQLDSYKGFDHVACYITGRADKVMNAVMENGSGSEVSADQFTVEEHPYEDTFSASDYLVITNHSDQTVSVFGNATAKDAAGATIGAADCTVDVLGPGEQTITYFYFSGVQGVDHVDYQLSYQVTNTWKPVLSDLSTDVSINNENVVVAVTNNGTEPADFVHVYALFYDAAGNVVNVDSSYTIDDDSELKAGATLSAQLNSYKAFDHVEVYLTGRR